MRFPANFIELLQFGQYRLLDLVLVGIACWAGVKLHRHPKQLWWLLAGIGCYLLKRNGIGNLWLIFERVSPGTFVSLISQPGGDWVYGTINLAVNSMLVGCGWWCVLNAAFNNRRGLHSDEVPAS